MASEPSEMQASVNMLNEDVQPSAPEIPAQGEAIGAVVYYSSVSQNTSRFVHHCKLEEEGINVYRIPILPSDGPLIVREPYILIAPTYGGGVVKKAVLPQIKKFLNNPVNREGIKGVIASGNTNFGEAFCMAGDLISQKCNVPFLYYFELMGTQEDEKKVREGVKKFFVELHEQKQ